MALGSRRTAGGSQVGGADGDILMLLEGSATFSQSNFWAVIENRSSNPDRLKEHNYTQTRQNWKRALLLTLLDWYR